MRRFLSWYLPERLPYISRGLYPVEIRAWALLSVAVAVVEGGVVGVIVKYSFAGTVSDLALNLAVALVAGAPAFANLASLLWSAVAQARPKVPLLSALQIAFVLCLLVIAVAPLNAWGLWLFVSSAVAARVFWSGGLTVRTTVWRANYPRHARANFAARITLVSSILIAVIAAVTGFLLDRAPEGFRWIYPAAALVGFSGAMLYRRVRVRGERALLQAEADEPQATVHWQGMLRVLRGDSAFRRYLGWMMVFGGGNLMLIAPLVLILSERLAQPPLVQLLLTAAIPQIVMPLTLPIWAKLLDRMHVLQYRARHSWVWVATSLCLVLGAGFGVTGLLWLGAVFWGTGYAGGSLSRSLGHHDFASTGQATEYMGVHVTLTGLRGLLAPLLGVGFYQLLTAQSPEYANWALLLPFTLTLAGAISFTGLARSARVTGNPD